MDGVATLRLRKPLKDNIQNLYHESYELMHCSYALCKQTTKEGQVAGDVIAGNIHIALPMLPTEQLLNWLFDTSKKYNGEVTIHDAHAESLEKIYFEEARPVNFRLHYEPNESSNFILILDIRAQRLIIGDAEYKNSWK